MDGNQFSIVTCWNARPDTPAAIGEKVLRTLDAVAARVPHFSSWGVENPDFDIDLVTEDNWREMAADTSLPLETVRDRFTDYIERCVWDGADPTKGYSTFASNETGVEELCPKSFIVSIRAGIQSKFLNHASFETGSDDVTPAPEIVTYAVVKSVFLSLLSIWSGDFGHVSSGALAQFRRRPRTNLELDWMTYLSPALAEQVLPLNGIRYETLGDGGILLIAAEETFDTNNAEHMSASLRMRAAMSPINNEEEVANRPRPDLPWAIRVE
jgi:hypothetical protein